MPYAGRMDRMAYLKHDTGETLCDFPLDSLYENVRDLLWLIISHV